MSDLAWHWVGDTLRNNDPIPEDGETLIYDGPVEMCSSGLHASRRVLDALRYAPGHTCCRVKIEDVVDETFDKLVAKRRTILWRVDAEEILRDFARICALDVINLWDAPGVVREYLNTGDESLRGVAKDAVVNATGTGGGDAGHRARVAAWCATRTGDAAVVAESAATEASLAVIWATSPLNFSTTPTVRDHQNRRLTSMIYASQPGGSFIG